jgi:microcystin-dependent protein
VSSYFVGQIMMTGFGFAQKNFAQCNGQLLGIQQNQALFSLLGTTYGGDGIRTFALPDLRSRTPTGGVQSFDGGWQPPSYVMGQVAGQEQVTLLVPELPAHTHSVTVTSDPGTGVPNPRRPGLTLASCTPDTYFQYGPAVAPMPLGGAPLSPSGGSQPHPNLQPYQTINFNIAMFGIFPSRN